MEKSQPHRKLAWEVEVPLKPKLKSRLPFTHIQSLLPTAVILSFFGNRTEVYEFMRVLCHKSRSFIVT